MFLNSIDIFLKVVEFTSFTQAARALGLPNSTVSLRVTQLEEALGVTLLHRTTRKVTVTDTGKAFYNRCVQAMGEIELAKDEASQASESPQGLLRVTAAIDLGHTILPPLIKRYTQECPNVTVQLICHNQVLDLIEENIDVAVRVGNLKDSTLKSRKLGESIVSLYTSPDYIAKHGKVNSPEELHKHEFLAFSGLTHTILKNHKLKKEYNFKFTSKIMCDDPQAMKSFLTEGMGIGLHTSFHTAEDIKDGTLVKVLPDWIIDSAPMYCVYPGQRFLTKKLRLFIDMAVDEFSKNPFLRSSD